jgi:hypothetical protein
MTGLLGRMLDRYCTEKRVRVSDYRMLIGTPEMKAKALRQIERRSKAAKAGWAKRRAIAAAARQGGDVQQAPGEAPQSVIAQPSRPSETNLG